MNFPSEIDTQPVMSQSPTIIQCDPNPINYVIRLLFIPNNQDWNDCGVITPIYNQGQCGSTWAISTVEEVETYCAIAGLPFEELSIQEVTVM